MRRGLLFLVMTVVVALGNASPLFADTQLTDRGLLITPPRSYLEVEPGKTTKSSLMIANLTQDPIDVALSFEQFSVADYTYDYLFEPPRENWITFDISQIHLEKTQNHTINYTIAAPKDARPGGHYFTLLASMSRGDGKKVRAATVVYITVQGDVKKEASSSNNAIPFLAMDTAIPYSFEARNTGNTHFLVYVSGELKGFLAKEKTAEAAHVLLPEKVRKIESTIPSPLLPGLYQASFGFRDEDGRETTHKQLILYAPLWSWALAIGLMWLAVAAIRRYRRVRNP